MQRANYEQALEAARRWIAEHDRYPQQQEWEHRALGRPTTRAIKRRWGWDELMRAAAGAGARSHSSPTDSLRDWKAKGVRRNVVAPFATIASDGNWMAPAGSLSFTSYDSGSGNRRFES